MGMESRGGHFHIVRRTAAALALVSSMGCGTESAGGKGNNGGSSGEGANAGTGGSSMAGEGGAAGTAGSSGGTGAASGSSSTDGGEAGTSGTGSGMVPLPDGSRERAGVVNIVDAEGAAALASYLNVESSETIATGLAKVTNLFLETYVEQYDFIFLVTDRDLGAASAGRFATVTGTAMLGTGLEYDVEVEGYKTNGRLRGIIGIDFNDYSGPFGHEMLHSWANFLDREFGFGVGLTEDYGVHWGYTGQRGILGGFDAATLECQTPTAAVPPNCTPETNGRYQYRVKSFGKGGNSSAGDVFSPIELYLMGLIPPSEVPSPILVLNEAADVSGSFDANTGTIGIEATGVNPVEMSEIIARHGETRELPRGERAFTAVFVVVSAMPATDEALDHVGDWSAMFGNRLEGDTTSFEALTGGRATLDTTLGPRRTLDEPPPELRIPKGCDLYEQDCDDDKACYFFESGNRCGLAGGAVRDEPCVEHAQCAAGLWCSYNTANTARACEPYCSLDTQAADACVNVCSAWLLVDDDGVEIGAACRAP